MCVRMKKEDSHMVVDMEASTLFTSHLFNINVAFDWSPLVHASLFNGGAEHTQFILTMEIKPIYKGNN